MCFPEQQSKIFCPRTRAVKLDSRCSYKLLEAIQSSDSVRHRNSGCYFHFRRSWDILISYLPMFDPSKPPTPVIVHQLVSYQHNHKLPPGIGFIPAFRISFFLASISSLNLTCSAIFPSLDFFSAMAAASHTVQQSACMLKPRLSTHTRFVRLRILLQFTHEIIKVLLLLNSVF